MNPNRSRSVGPGLGRVLRHEACRGRPVVSPAKRAEIQVLPGDKILGTERCRKRENVDRPREAVQASIADQAPDLWQ